MRRIFLTIVAALAMSSNMFAQKYVMQVNMKDFTKGIIAMEKNIKIIYCH